MSHCSRHPRHLSNQCSAIHGLSRSTQPVLPCVGSFTLSLPLHQVAVSRGVALTPTGRQRFENHLSSGR